MKTSLLPLQGAIYTRLANDTALNNIITGVYDQVSETAVKPYVTLGEQTVSARYTKNYDGENILTTLHCWSDYEGDKEAKQILDAMLQALTNEPLQVSGFSVVFSELDQMRVFTDIDGTTRHGVIQLRYYINQ